MNTPPRLKAPSAISVWPDLAPGETTESLGDEHYERSDNITRRTNVTCPMLYLYGFDDSAIRPAVMVCPGGGYEILATDLEGSEIARWLNAIGFVAAVLHYRVPENRNGALQDAQRSMSLLRSKGADFGIDPRNLGAMGFSAGGHLTARLSVHGDDHSYGKVDDSDRYPCAPNFAALIYPAYLMVKDTGTPAPEVAPHTKMPPTMLVQTKDDPHFCTTVYAEFLDEVEVDNENIVYEIGGHGYGLRLPTSSPAAKWPTAAADWLINHLH